MTAFYNEIDPFKAEVIREAIKAGAIAPGDVDERSIADVRPGELVGYTQCHFFAGGGFWSLALRQAGWPDDREAWTGSCPCPSFSAAGKGLGFADPRHLWPEWARLIRECRPSVVFGEQVAAAIGHGWLDLVSGDMEAEGYAFAAAVLGAHSVGAPHIRQRLYFCADTEHDGGRPDLAQREKEGRTADWRDSAVGNRADTEYSTEERFRQHCGEILPIEETSRLGRDSKPIRPWRGTGRQQGDCESGAVGDASSGADTASRRPQHEPDAGCSSVLGKMDGSREGGEQSGGDRTGTLGGDHALSPRLEGHFGDVREWRGPGWLDPLTARSVAEAGATRGFWADCDWWYGRDGKYRPIGPGLQPLATGSAARVGRLRIYGDAICVPAAQAFIEAYLESVTA